MSENQTITMIPLFEIAYGDHFRGESIQEGDPKYTPMVGVGDLIPSIKKHGLKRPVTVWRDPELDNGPFSVRLIAGMRRITALKKLVVMGALEEEVEVPCIVREDVEDRVHAKREALVDHSGQKGLSRFEVAAYLYEMASKGSTRAELAEEFCLSETTIGNYISFYKRATKELKAALARNNINLREAMTLVDLAPDKQIEKLHELLNAKLEDNVKAQEVWQKILKAAGRFKPFGPGARKAYLKECKEFVKQHEGDEEYAEFVAHATIAIGVIEFGLCTRFDKTEVLFGYSEDAVDDGEGETEG